MEHAKLEKMGEVPVDLSLALQSYEKSGKIPKGSRVTAVTIYYECPTTPAEEAEEILTLGGDNGRALTGSQGVADHSGDPRSPSWKGGPWQDR